MSHTSEPELAARKARRARSGVRATNPWAAARSSDSNWLAPPPLPPPSEIPGDIYQPIPRRHQLKVDAEARLAPAMMTELRFEVGTLALLGRLLLWFWGALQFTLGTGLDLVLFRRDRGARKWVRLRRTFESLGGTFVKVGQQLSMRVDLLPVELCDELGKLLDKVPPFDWERAKTSIARAIGAPLPEVFATFDPNPVGSASIACVYQAVLKSGERVAVKVRRPDIGKLFVADLRALGLLLKLLELLTIVRDDFFKHLRADLATMLMEELDFRVEARNQELFRSSVRKTRLRHISAPKVHFDLSNEEVLVSDYISGVWLSELLTAVESADGEALQRLKEIGITPKGVSHRLMVASLFAIYDGILFHADPHPANILVKPDNELVLIDFGSCGSYSDRERRLMQQMQYHMTRLEPTAMVRVALAMQEPLPPVDVSQLAKKLEMAWWRSLKALKSRHAKWWERTTAGLWLNIMNATREFQVPMNMGMLKGIRSTMLYDTIAARLNPQLNAIKEARRYWKSWQVRRRKQIARELRRTRRKLTPRKAILDGYMALKGFEELATKGRFQIERMLDTSSFNFSHQVAKASFLGLKIIRLQFSVILVTLVWVAGLFLHHRHLAMAEMSFWESVKAALASRGYWAVLGLLVFHAVRQVQFRFADKEVD